MMSGKAFHDSLTAIGVMVVIAGLAIGIAYCESGCAAGQETLAKQSYKEERMRCVERYETVEEVRACDNKVKEKWGQGVVERTRDGGIDGSR